MWFLLALVLAFAAPCSAQTLYVSATFANLSALEQFESTQPISVEIRNTTELTLQFTFMGANASATLAYFADLSDEARAVNYGIVAWNVIATTSIAPTPAATFTAAPIDPAQPHMKFELYFLDDVLVDRDLVLARVCQVVQIPLWRLSAGRQVLRVQLPEPANAPPYVYRQLIYFYVTDPPPGAPPSNDNSGNFTSVVVINTRLLERQPQLFGILPYFVGMMAVPNSMTFTAAQVAADGSKSYSQEKLRFMGALIACFVVLGGLLVAGWIRTQQLADADLEARIALAQQTQVRRVVEASSPGASPRAITPSPTRTKRSVSFHHSATENHREL